MIRRIDPQMFVADYGMVHCSIFSGRSVEFHPFENLDWKILLVPGGVNIERDVFDALASMAWLQGDAECCITDFETIPPHQESVAVGWSFHEFRGALGTYPLLHTVDVHLFGKSGSWGMICYYDDFSCMGLDPRIAEIFTDQLGGEEIVKQRFLRFSEENWFIDGRDKAKLLRCVGWGP